jgi:hypothetical protein
MSKRNSVTFLMLTLLLLSLAGCAHHREAAISRFDQVVDELIARGYPEEVESHPPLDWNRTWEWLLEVERIRKALPMPSQMPSRDLSRHLEA